MEKIVQKIFFSSLREHAANAINFERKKMLLLTEKELKLHQNLTAVRLHLWKKVTKKVC